MATDVTEVWFDRLPSGAPHDPLTCPRCGGARFTAEHMAHGVTLACVRCRTFIGICASLNGATSGDR